MKSINDTYGHAEGDRALIDTADLVRSSLRSSDVVARLGGDEVCALLTDCEPSTAAMVIERVKEPSGVTTTAATDHTRSRCPSGCPRTIPNGTVTSTS
jgi:diguanylate cyclase (GGDEF)-like protein